MKETDVKILVCGHRPAELPSHPYFYPVQVGAALHEERFFPAHDDTGDNISAKNASFCELTAHYWAWKNLKADIIGLNHYRRYFDFFRPFPRFSPDRSFVDLKSFLQQPYRFPDLDALLTDYDIVLASRRHYPYDVYTQYCVFHLVNDLRMLRKVVADLSPDYLPAFDELFFHRNAYSGYNMFITRWTHFEGYSEWLFRILFELERRVPLSPYPDQARLFGYMSERLINVYCIRHGLRVKYVPVIMPLDEPFCNPSNLRYVLWRHHNNLVFDITKKL
jgi:hypothetical protein